MRQTEPITLPTEQEAEAVQQLARDLAEILEGVHELAAKALDALRTGDWPEAVQLLKRLEHIE